MAASVAHADTFRLHSWTAFAMPVSPTAWYSSHAAESARPFWAGVNFFGKTPWVLGGTVQSEPIVPQNPPISGTTGGGQDSGGDGGYSLTLVQWPVGNVTPPLNLGEPGVFGTTQPTVPPGDFTGSVGPTDQSVVPPGQSSGDSGPDPDPGVTVVPLPAAAWSGLIALPAAIGAGWARRRRQRA